MVDELEIAFIKLFNFVEYKYINTHDNIISIKRNIVPVIQQTGSYIGHDTIDIAQNIVIKSHELFNNFIFRFESASGDCLNVWCNLLMNINDNTILPIK